MPQQVDVPVRVLNTSSVGEMKGMYAEKKNCGKEEIRLFFGGKELKDEMTLQDYNIQNAFVIQVFHRK